MGDFENKRVNVEMYLGPQVLPIQKPYGKSKRRGSRRINNRNRHIRLKVIARDGLKCCWCGVMCDPNSKPSADNHPTLEHVIPKSMGGGTTQANGKIACRKCNSSHVNEKQLTKKGVECKGWDTVGSQCTLQL